MAFLCTSSEEGPNSVGHSVLVELPIAALMRRLQFAIERFELARRRLMLDFRVTTFDSRLFVVEGP